MSATTEALARTGMISRRPINMLSLATILKTAQRDCFDNRTLVNNFGGDDFVELLIDKPIIVGHTILIDPMEKENLWMYVGNDVKSTSLLRYTPRRTIVFSDFNSAMRFINVSDFMLPWGSPGFSKKDGMKMLNDKLGTKYDSLVFKSHLDRMSACGRRCCKSGSKLRQEMVSLNSWNMSTCPGHPHL